MVEREMQSASLKKVELACSRLELEVKESAERAARAEAERDAACHEAAMAKLATEGAVNTRAQIESELARVQRALALADNALQRAESEHGLVLIMELGTIKDEFVAFREKAIADKETMEAEFDSNGDALFNYGYGCCVFTHNICGSKPQIPDGMPDPSVLLTPEFFANPRCLPSTSATAPALNPVAVCREDRSENNPVAVGEETTLPMDLPAE